MSAKGLKTRYNIDVGRSAQASLVGHRLVFNVGPERSQSMDGGAKYGNVEPAEGEDVHGVVHWVADTAIHTLDNIEGPGYDRVWKDVVTYSGEQHRALLYIQTRTFPGRVMESGLPSTRYLKILLMGAREAGLTQEWIAHLEATPAQPFTPLVLTDQHRKDILAREWTREEIEADGDVYECNGVVLRVHPDTHSIYRQYLKQDVTPFLCKLVSYEPSCTDFATAGPDQRAFVEGWIANSLLHGAGAAGHVAGCAYLKQ